MALIGRALVSAGLMACTFACASTPSPAAQSASAPRRATIQVDGDEPLMTTLSTTRVTRKILMVYRLDLLKDNAHSVAVAQVIRANEPQIRSCYARRLNEATDLKGRLALTFGLNKTTGKMERVRRTGGSLKDQRLVSCVTRRLARLTFNVPYDMRGRLDYLFDSRDTIGSR